MRLSDGPCRRVCAAVALVVACLGARAEPAPERPGPTIELLGTTQVPMFNGVDGRRIGGLSGLTYDRGRWLAVTDDKQYPRVVELRVAWEHEQRRLTVTVIGVRDIPGAKERQGAVRDYTDAESIAADGAGGFFVGFEEPTLVAHFAEAPPADPGRNSVGELTRTAIFQTPARVREHVRFNRGYESVVLVTTPGGGREVWATTEAALDCDGPEASAESGSLCRIVVYDAESGAEVREHVYESQPAPRTLPGIKSYNSLSEMTPLDAGRVLSLERRFGVYTGYDSAIRLVTLFAGETDVRGVDSLPAARGSWTPVKVETLTTLRTLGVPWSANFEALALGPELPEEAGGGVLALTLADDNFGDDGQVFNAAAALRVTLPGRGAR